MAGFIVCGPATIIAAKPGDPRRIAARFCPNSNHFMAENRPDCPEFVGDLVN